MELNYKKLQAEQNKRIEFISKLCSNIQEGNEVQNHLNNQEVYKFWAGEKCQTKLKESSVLDMYQQE